MPDNYATLEPDEQKYFDTEGAEVPKEQPVQPKGPAPKQTKKIGKAVSKDAPSDDAPVETEADIETADPAPVKKTAEQEQIDNLNAALRQERMEAKERERRTEDRLKQLQEAVKPQSVPQAQQPQEIPDPDKDPLGALKHILNQQRQQQQTQQQTEQERQQIAQTQRIMGEAGRLENEYLTTLPDFDPTARVSPSYNEASAFLVNMRRAELNAIGAYNPMQINQMISQEAIGLAAQALQVGKNPAQVVMEVAKARGFAPKAKVVEEAPKETEQEKILRIAKGQDAGFSLSQASGSKAPRNGQLDAKTLANMSDEDFSAVLAKAKKSELRGLMGD